MVNQIAYKIMHYTLGVRQGLLDRRFHNNFWSVDSNFGWSMYKFLGKIFDIAYKVYTK